MRSEDPAAPPEQALTEALLCLSWPLPRTVEDADAALTRLEQVRAVLTRLEQESVGSEAWWAGQVDALSTQSGFVLEWWRPVLRDPELDWTLNHQAHLTADLATLASAGARLLDRMEPQATQEAAAAHARRAEGRWGPAAVPPLVAAAGAAGANGPGARPRPPAEVFGRAFGEGSGQDSGASVGKSDAAVTVDTPAVDTAASATEAAPPLATPNAPVPAPPPSPPAGELEAPVFPPMPAEPSSGGAARHRRPAYDFDDAEAAPPATAVPIQPPAPAPAATAPPSPAAPPMPPSARAYPVGPPAPVAPGNHNDDDDDDPPSLVPTALRRHQRRLLMQTAAILAAIGVLCWWAVYSLGSGSSHPSASAPHTTPADSSAPDGAGTGATDARSSAAPSSATSSSASASQGPQSPVTSAAPAPSTEPSTASSSVADGTSVSSVRVTLLGGSSSVPQIVALITVHAAGTEPINVTGAYYGARGSAQVARQTDHWTFSGHTTYQYTVPIANGPYCGTTFHFTLSAGGHEDQGTTSPGC